MNLHDRICGTCGERFGAHYGKVDGEDCPILVRGTLQRNPDEHARTYWSETTTKPIAVGNPQYGKLHQYRLSFNDPSRQQMLCSGEWYDLEMAPCVVAMERALPDPADLPPCEMTDEDLAAARELLGNPGITICKQKGRASWNDVVISPDAVQTNIALRTIIRAYEAKNPGLATVAGLKDLVAP